MRRLLTLIPILVLFAGCVRHTSAPVQDPAPQGPPEIQYDIVEQHATQFDVDFPDRPPGSQHELAAASYILGHLQLAGFSPRLDRVPVADVVNSTNVVAMPPNGSEPEYLITVAYDTGARQDDGGRYIGLFLELARALTVADPQHLVGFVAIGAESSEHRGTRRLAQFLLEELGEGVDPKIISISMTFSEGDDALIAAGFQHEFLYGQVNEVGDALMTELAGAES